MIEVPATEVIDNPGFVPEVSRFRVDPPASTPLMAATPITFSQQGKEFEATPVESAPHNAEIDNPNALLEKIVSESQRQVERYPASSHTHINLGLALLNCGRLDQAASEFEKALHISPGLYLPSASLARVKILQGRLEEAEQIFLQLQQIRPADPYLLMNLADVAIRRGQFEEAARLWKKVFRLKPNDASTHFNLGIALLATQQTRDAIKHLKAAAHLDVRSPVMHYGLGIAYLFAENPLRAAQAFKAALTLVPGMSEAIHGLAEALLKQDKVEEVVDLLTKHLKNKADDYEAREHLAFAYIQQEQYKKVRSELFEALKLVPKTGDNADIHQARMMNNLGVCYALLKNPEEAERLFRNSIQAKPNLAPGTYHNLIRLLIQLRRFGEVRQIIGACRAQFPNDEKTKMLFVRLLEAEEHYDEAIIEARKTVQTEEASLEACKQLANLLMDWKQDYSAALAVLHETRKRFPTNIGILNTLAYAHLMQGDIIAGRAALTSVPKKVPENEKILLSATWGLAHLLEGDFKKGKEGYIQAEQLAKQQGKSEWIPQIQQKMHLELARAYQRAGDVKAAQHEVRAGLTKQGSESYHRDLKLLAQALQARRS